MKKHTTLFGWLAALFLSVGSADLPAQPAAQTDTNSGPVAQTPANSYQPSTSTNKDEVIKLAPFTLNENTAKGYATENTLAGSRIVLPIIDTPVTIVTIDRDLMDDVKAIEGYDVVRWVGGLGPAAQNGIGAYSLNGNLPRAGSSDFIDGLPSAESEQEPEFTDRWEILKGAAGTLYGDVNLGGVINQVYKRPQAIEHTTIRTTYDTIGSTPQVTIDTTGPIQSFAAGQVTYRLIFVDREGKDSIGTKGDKQAYYAEVDYKPKMGNALFWGRFTYRRVDRYEGSFDGLIDNDAVPSYKIFGRRPILPISDNLTNMFRYYEAGFTDRVSGSLGDWAVRFVIRNNDDTYLPTVLMSANGAANSYTFYDASGNAVGTIGSNPGTAGEATFRGTPWTDIKLSTTSITWNRTRSIYTGEYFDVTGDFNIGPFNNKLVAYTQGLEQSSLSETNPVTLNSQYGGAINSGNYNAAAAFSIVHPVNWDKVPVNQMFTFNSVPNSWTYTPLYTFSSGAQDSISFWDDRIILVGGLRYDFVFNPGTLIKTTGVQQKESTTINWENKLSILVKPFPNPNIALFFNHATTFVPEFGLLVQGQPDAFKNETGTTNEGGIKLDLFDARLTLTSSYYKASLSNLPIASVNLATGFNEFTQAAASPSSGWSADATYRLGNWQGIIGMANGTSKAEQSNGKYLYLRGVMNGFNYKGLIRYSFSTEALKGLALGTGVVHIADRMDTANTWIAPGYNEWNAFVEYVWENWRFQVNCNNLGDVIAIQGVTGTVSNALNEPRAFIFSAQFDF